MKVMVGESTVWFAVFVISIWGGRSIGQAEGYANQAKQAFKNAGF